jgi:hypothetical protein
MVYPIGLAVSVTLSVINDMAAVRIPASLDRNLCLGREAELNSPMAI